MLQDEQPSGATADYADLTARLRNTTLSGGQLLTPGSVSGCAFLATSWRCHAAEGLDVRLQSLHIHCTKAEPVEVRQWPPSAERGSEVS